MSNLSTKEIETFKFLEDWLHTVMEFWEKLYPPSDGILWKDDLLPIKTNKKWLNGLKQTYNDTIEMIRDLSPVQYKELDLILRTKFGHGLHEADKKQAERIQKLIDKGKITTEVQYYLLREYLERAWDIAEQKENMNKIEQMMELFEHKK